jgi:inhibitor of KinA
VRYTGHTFHMTVNMLPKTDGVAVYPVGDSALTVEFGREISTMLNERALALADVLEERRFVGYIEAVPSYASVTVFYDGTKIRRSHSSAFDYVRSFIHSLLPLAERVLAPSKRFEIPVRFDDDAALDIDTIAGHTGFERDEAINLFLDREYRVYALGFLPGFPYMGEVDERLNVPRRQTPRTCVPRGSVGIAGRQTGIYPVDSPGGWHVIGRTAVNIFVPENDPPVLLSPGDVVRFTRA